jgi:uncharacterized membrane protein
MDAILSGNLMGAVSMLASTSVLLMLAVFTAFGNLSALTVTLDAVGLSTGYTDVDLQVHLFVMLAMFALSFFSFTLSLRQFNHFCIMLGAMNHDGHTTEAEIDAIAQLNMLAARNFNNGIRAYYFSIGTVAWFANPWLAIAVSLVTAAVIVHREFFSSAHRVAASVAVLASRREQDHPTA